MQLDLDGREHLDVSTVDHEQPAEPAGPPVQLGLDVDVPVAIRLPRGLGIAYQEPLASGKE